MGGPVNATEITQQDQRIQKDQQLKKIKNAQTQVYFNQFRDAIVLGKLGGDNFYMSLKEFPIRITFLD